MLYDAVCHANLQSVIRCPYPIRIPYPWDCRKWYPYPQKFMDIRKYLSAVLYPRTSAEAVTPRRPFSRWAMRNALSSGILIILKASAWATSNRSSRRSTNSASFNLWPGVTQFWCFFRILHSSNSFSSWLMQCCFGLVGIIAFSQKGSTNWTTCVAMSRMLSFCVMCRSMKRPKTWRLDGNLAPITSVTQEPSRYICVCPRVNIWKWNANACCSVGAYSSSWNSPQNYGTPLVNGITQCYLPPDRGVIVAFTPTGQVGTRFIDPVIGTGPVLGTGRV